MEPGRSRTVAAVLLSTLVAPLGVPLVSPALPAIRDAFGLTAATASLLVSAYFLPGVVLAPVVGTVADRVGPRRVLVGSLVGFGVTGGAIAAAPTFAAALAIRVVQGVAATGVFVTAVVILGARFEGASRRVALGWNVAALSAGAAVYPLVGGALAAVSWNAPFLAYLVALPVALVAHVAIDSTHRPAVAPSRLRAALGAVATLDRWPLYLSAFLSDAFLLGVVLTTVPFLLAGEYGLSSVGVGAIVTAGMGAAFVVSLAGGRLGSHVSNRALIAAGHGCYAVGMAGVWLAGSPVGVAAAVVVHGAGVGLSLPAVDAAISDRSTAGARAGALGLRVSASFAGRTLGPVAFAAVGDPSALLGGVAIAGIGLLAVARGA